METINPFDVLRVQEAIFYGLHILKYFLKYIFLVFILCEAILTPVKDNLSVKAFSDPSSLIDFYTNNQKICV